MKISKKTKLEYENDFSKWADNQATFLRKGDFSRLDRDNLAEEMESLGRSERRTLRSYLEVLLMHMLKVMPMVFERNLSKFRKKRVLTKFEPCLNRRSYW